MVLNTIKLKSEKMNKDIKMGEFLCLLFVGFIDMICRGFYLKFLYKKKVTKTFIKVEKSNHLILYRENRFL